MSIAHGAASKNDAANKNKPPAALDVGWKDFLDVRFACSKTHRLPNKQAPVFGRFTQRIESKRNSPPVRVYGFGTSIANSQTELGRDARREAGACCHVDFR
jgi:hypothetical protein